MFFEVLSIIMGGAALYNNYKQGQKNLEDSAANFELSKESFELQKEEFKNNLLKALFKTADQNL